MICVQEVVLWPSLLLFVVSSVSTIDPFEVHRGDVSTTYSGKQFRSSHIVQPLVKRHLIILATEKFTLDSDVTLEDCHLTILTPVLEVVGEDRSLTSKGGNGDKFFSAALEGSNGMDGRNGYSPGDVTIFAMEVINPGALRVRSVGGNGGDGQEGGRGHGGQRSVHFAFSTAHGSERQLREQISIRRRFTATTWRTLLHLPQDTVQMLVYRETERRVDLIVEVESTQGLERPKNGATGGDGGLGAEPGAIQIRVMRSGGAQISVSKTKGSNGAGGRGGQPGEPVPSCAKTGYLCQAVEKSTFVFGVRVGKDEANDFQCDETSRSYCEDSFTAQTGRRGDVASSGMQWLPVASGRRCKFQPAEDFEESVAKFKKHAYALHEEVDGILKNFLGFISMF